VYGKALPFDAMEYAARHTKLASDFDTDQVPLKPGLPVDCQNTSGGFVSATVVEPLVTLVASAGVSTRTVKIREVKTQNPMRSTGERLDAVVVRTDAPLKTLK